MTTNPEASEAVRRRTDLIADLHDLAAFLAIQDTATPLPVVSANFRVPDGPRGERIAYLDTIGDLLRVDVTEDRIGTLYAERPFGSIRAEAHLCHPDQTVSGAKARAASAGTGAQA
jgi:hypothetical protein